MSGTDGLSQSMAEDFAKRSPLVVPRAVDDADDVPAEVHRLRLEVVAGLGGRGSSMSNEVSPWNEVQPRFSPETRVLDEPARPLTPVSLESVGDGTVVVTPFSSLMMWFSAQVTSPLLRMKGPPRMWNMVGVARTAGVSSGVQRTTASWEDGTYAAPYRIAGVVYVGRHSAGEAGRRHQRSVPDDVRRPAEGLLRIV